MSLFAYESLNSSYVMSMEQIRRFCTSVLHHQSFLLKKNAAGIKKKKRNLCNFIIHKGNYLLSNTTETDEKVDERTEEEKNRKGGRKRLYEGVSAHKRPSHDVFKELWQIPWICSVDYKFTQTQQHSDTQTHFFRASTFIRRLSAAAGLKRQERWLG